MNGFSLTFCALPDGLTALATSRVDRVIFFRQVKYNSTRWLTAELWSQLPHKHHCSFSRSYKKINKISPFPQWKLQTVLPLAFVSCARKVIKWCITILLDKLPATAAELLAALTCFPVESCEGAFTGRSDKTEASDGTKEARSGGWSFPTGGLAYQWH